MQTDSFGGSCPCCGKTMFLHYWSGPTAGASFDACPWCGFAYEARHGQAQDAEVRGAAFWENALGWLATVNGAPEVETREQFVAHLRLDPEHYPETDTPEEAARRGDPWPSVFDYSTDGEEELARCRA